MDPTTNSGKSKKTMKTAATMSQANNTVNTAKSTKSHKSMKGRPNNNEERRVVVYNGPKRTKSEMRLKKDGLYDLLEVSPDASQGEIKRSYRRLALKLHPDKNRGAPNQEAMTERLNQVNRAYAILSDENKRKIYDKYGIAAVQMKEETQCPNGALWFMFTRCGRALTVITSIFTCCFCCFCCFACCCNCFCNCCCNRCCGSGQTEDNDGYMDYQAGRPPPPPAAEPGDNSSKKSVIKSVIKTVSVNSQKVLKKKGDKDKSGKSTSVKSQRPDTPATDLITTGKEKKADPEVAPPVSLQGNVTSQTGGATGGDSAVQKVETGATPEAPKKEDSGQKKDEDGTKKDDSDENEDDDDKEKEKQKQE
uniref:J domain-containing protein n=1 Tax=Panagrellus redivivus TaxID=6233 RepID=A0A7E4VCN9_PANRE